ncbi:MAG: hypothetical protein NXI23_20995 [Bacteroidetes bacterium]|nr:hypothetical protein [Bacteroidota bacterium]
MQNFGKPGATPQIFYDKSPSSKWTALVNSRPVYAILMFGQNGPGEGGETAWKKDLSSMCTDLLSAGTTPIILPLTPERVPGGSPAPLGYPGPGSSAMYDFVTYANDVYVNLSSGDPSLEYFNSSKTLVSFFNTKGGTWVENNINATDGSGLVHYQPKGAVYIAQQIAALLPTAITQYLNNPKDIASNFSCTANCSYSTGS